MRRRAKKIHMKELQDLIGRYNGLAWVGRIMHLSLNTRPANTVFYKGNIFFYSKNVATLVKTLQSSHIDVG
jgi:hypothetical protein